MKELTTINSYIINVMGIKEPVKIAHIAETDQYNKYTVEDSIGTLLYIIYHYTKSGNIRYV